jgi:hypothetical protein
MNGPKRRPSLAPTPAACGLWRMIAREPQHKLEERRPGHRNAEAKVIGIRYAKESLRRLWDAP